MYNLAVAPVCVIVVCAPHCGDGQRGTDELSKDSRKEGAAP